MKSNLISTADAAAYLGGFRKNTIDGWRTQGIGPRYYKIGRLIRYSPDDLDAFLEAGKRNSTSQAGAK